MMPATRTSGGATSPAREARDSWSAAYGTAIAVEQEPKKNTISFVRLSTPQQYSTVT